MPEKMNIIKEGLKSSLYNSQTLKITVICIELFIESWNDVDGKGTLNIT